MTHTPGPWFITGRLGYEAPIICNSRRLIAKALYDGGSVDPEVDDNAALIATAPELLQRLKEARAAIASLPDDALGVAGSDRYQWPIKAEFLSYVDDAIAKAEGKQ